MAAVPFPLRRLPKKAHNNVFRTMTLDDIIITSMCSKATKSRVTGLKFKLKSFVVVFQGPQILLDCGIRIAGCDKSTVITLHEPLALQGTVDIVYYGGGNQPNSNRTIQNFELSVRKWIVLISTLFNASISCVAPTIDINMYERNWLINVFKGLTNIELVAFNQIPLTTCHELVLKVFPRVSNVIHSQAGLEPKTLFHKILMQNLEAIEFAETRSVLKLEDLLVANCGALYMPEAVLSNDDWNRFLKLWMNEKILKLEYLGLCFDGAHPENDMNQILRGIQTRKMDPEEERRRRVGLADLEAIVKNGFVMRLASGIEATLSINNDTLEFVVWN